MNGRDWAMMILPLHGTLDFHDGIAVVVFALTLAMGSLLGSLRRQQRGEGAALTPPPVGGTPLPPLEEGKVQRGASGKCEDL